MSPFSKCGCNISYQASTMLFCLCTLDSLRPIHTWNLVALTTHTKDDWINDSHVAPTTLKLRAHMLP